LCERLSAAAPAYEVDPLGEMLRQEIGATVASPEEIDGEVRHTAGGRRPLGSPGLVAEIRSGSFSSRESPLSPSSRLK
jgi:hypothetical protein